MSSLNSSSGITNILGGIGAEIMQKKHKIELLKKQLMEEENNLLSLYKSKR